MLSFEGFAGSPCVLPSALKAHEANSAREGSPGPDLGGSSQGRAQSLPLRDLGRPQLRGLTRDSRKRP